MADENKTIESDQDQTHLQQVGEFFHNLPESVHEAFARHRNSAFHKHPFFFSTIGLLGLVATWQGFEDIVERISYFDAHPGSLLIIGLIILLLTGRLYRQMDQ